MSIIFDIAVLVIIAICVISAIIKGFVKSLLGTVAIVIALLTAINLSPMLAEPISNGYIYDYTVSKIEPSLEKNDSGESELISVINKLPKSLGELLSDNGVDAENIKNSYDDVVLRGEDSPERVVAKELAKPISKMLSKAIAFALIFLVTILLLHVLIFFIDKISRLPVLNIMNKGLGAVIGAVRGLVFAVSISLILCYLLPILSVVNSGIPSDIIDNTVIVKYLGNFEFLALF